MYKALIPLFILILSACGSQNSAMITSEEESINELSNSIITFNQISLDLVSIKTPEQFYSLDKGMNITLNINVDEGRYNGKSGCNSYFGGVEIIDQDKIYFSPGGITEMMCEKPIMIWESRFLNALMENQFFVNEAENTIIFSDPANGYSMTFTKSMNSEN